MERINNRLQKVEEVDKMKKRIAMLMRTVLLAAILLCMPAAICHADVNEKALEGYLNNSVIRQQMDHCNNPKYAVNENTQENIDPITGILSLSETDLTLPGKDGMDLTIGRNYNSSRDECERRVEIVNEQGSYYYTVSGYNVYVIFENYMNRIGTYSTEAAANEVRDYYMKCVKGVRVAYTWLEEEVNVGYYTDIKTYNYVDKYSYDKTRYNLGAGWAFSFPSVEIVKHSDGTYRYYHDENGEVYSISSIEETGKSNLEGYQGSDVKFLKDQGSYVNEDQVASKYKFIDSDKTTTYFGEDGRILGKRDRLGNEIKFRHTLMKIYDKSYPLISQITDSTGRVIHFSYGENTITISVTIPGENDEMVVQYVREMRQAKYLKRDGYSYDSYTYPVLTKMINPNGEEKYYEDFYHYNNNTLPEENYEYTPQSSYQKPVSCNMARYLIGAVVYKGYKTRYDYEKVIRNSGKDGKTEAYRIKDRFEQIQRMLPDDTETLSDWEGSYNRIDYTYGGDCTGYPTYKTEENLPESYQFWSAATDSTGLSHKYVFNGTKQLICQEDEAANGEKNVTSYETFDTNYKNKPTLIKTSSYASDGTLANELYEQITYNNWGGVTTKTKQLTLDQLNDSNVKSKYTTSYYYEDSRFPYFLTREQYYQNDQKMITQICQYDDLGRVVSMTDQNGQKTIIKYYKSPDGDYVEETFMVKNGNEVKNSKVIYGSETNYAYPKEQVIYSVASDGTTTEINNQFTYNRLLGLVMSEQAKNKPKVTYKYDAMGNILEEDYGSFSDREGYIYNIKNITQYKKGYYKAYTDKNAYLYGTNVYTYTQYSKRTSEHNRLVEGPKYYDCKESFYDSFGNLRLERSSNGDKWSKQQRYEYDGVFRPVKITDETNQTTALAYDAWGNTKESTDARGNLYVTELDRKLNCTKSYLVASKNIQSYRANPTANQYKEDYVETYHDQFGQDIERRVYTDWPSQNHMINELYTYDYVGNVIGFLDPNKNQNEDGYTKTCEYDGTNQVTKIKNALNEVTEVTYAGDGAIEKVTVKENEESNQPLTVYEKKYDSLLNISSRIDASQNASSYAYNSSGQLISFMDRNGTTEEKTYDYLDRITGIQLVNGDNSKKLSYTSRYDSLYGSTEEIMCENDEITSFYKYSYNRQGLVEEKRAGVNNLRARITMEYNNNLLTKLGVSSTSSDGFFTNFAISEDGLLTQVQIDGKSQRNTGTESNVQYTYCPDGFVEKMVYPSINQESLESNYEYNAQSRLIKLTNKLGSNILSEFEYQYDNNGNIISATNNGLVTNYEYDKLNRLIKSQTENGTVRNYHYDILGNRIEAEQSDAKRSSCQYEYDLDNRIQSVTNENGTTSMEYYPDGLRASKTTQSDTTSYIYDDDQHLVAEAENASSITSYYVWDNKKVVAKLSSDNKEYFYLYNGHGDVVQIIDEEGYVVNSYEYDEWGIVTDSREKIRNPFGYSCAVYDEELGCYYLNARYYDPAMGRFLTEDNCEGDVGNIQSLNPYIYCMNNPLLFSDSGGNSSELSLPAKAKDGLKKIKRKIEKEYSKFTDSDAGEKFLNFFDFYKDGKGIYHVKVDCWQKYGGYCNFYDRVFGWATDMKRQKFNFTYNKEEFVVWCWKGNYLNLGAGCELGIYKETIVPELYKCYTKSNIKMSLRLYYKHKLIASYNPTEAQWWITAFHPGYRDKQANDLAATFVLSFKNTGQTDMFDAMWREARYGNNKSKWKDVIFNRKKKTVTFKI